MNAPVSPSAPRRPSAPIPLGHPHRAMLALACPAGIGYAASAAAPARAASCGCGAQLDRRGVHRAQAHVAPGQPLADQRGHPHHDRGRDLDRLQDDPVAERVGLTPTP